LEKSFILLAENTDNCTTPNCTPTTATCIYSGDWSKNWDSALQLLGRLWELCIESSSLWLCLHGSWGFGGHRCRYMHWNFNW
jgi:hypothetical protein